MPLLPVAPVSLAVVAMALLFAEAVALHRRSEAAFKLGLPGRWRVEAFDRPTPRPAVDMLDRLDRDHSLPCQPGEAASYLRREGELDVIGLVPAGPRLGVKHQLALGPFGLMGVLATGQVEIDRSEAATTIRWRPVYRLAPWLLIASLIALAQFQFGELIAGHLAPALGVYALWVAVALWASRRTVKAIGAMVDRISMQLLVVAPN